MKKIPLRGLNGRVRKWIKVDDEDYDELMKWRWALKENGNINYAYRSFPRVPGEVRKSIQMHRQIMKPPPGMVVDHINHDGLDNRRANLRNVFARENNRNRASANRNSKSQIPCVHYLEKTDQWRASVQVYLGVFASKEEASQAVKWFKERNNMLP